MVANAPRESAHTWARLTVADSLDKPYIGNYRQCGNVRALPETRPNRTSMWLNVIIPVARRKQLQTA